MLITEKIGTLENFPVQDRCLDYVVLEWYETNKRIQHKKSSQGQEIQLKFLQGDPQFRPGDVIFADELSVGVIEIAETDVIAVIPQNMQDMAAMCYEIGNKHLPLFYQQEEILVAFDTGLFRFLQASGYTVQKTRRKLVDAIRTTVAAHGAGKSLFNRILQLTTEQG